MNRISKDFYFFAYICGIYILHIALLPVWNGDVSGGTYNFYDVARTFLLMASLGSGLIYWGWKSKRDPERKIGFFEKIFRWLVILSGSVIIFSMAFAFITFTVLFLVS